MKKHSIEEDETNTVSIDRQDIKSKIKEEMNKTNCTNDANTDC